MLTNKHKLLTEQTKKNIFCCVDGSQNDESYLFKPKTKTKTYFFVIYLFFVLTHFTHILYEFVKIKLINFYFLNLLRNWVINL